MKDTHRSRQEKTARIADGLERLLGFPERPEQSSTALDVLIATLLSQNTNDQNSHRAYLNLKANYRTWDAVVDATAEEIASVIRIGGMANQRSVRIKRILLAIKRRYGSYSLSSLKRQTTQDAFDVLLSMKGIGAKTAACVLLFALGRDIFPVDTHIHRVCRRLGLTLKARTPEQSFGEMKSLVPAGRAYSFHINLIRFGRTICRSQRPTCGECPFYDECCYES